MKKIQYIKNAVTRIIVFLLVVIGLSFAPDVAHAQDEDDPGLDLPCGGEDPYADACPLDSWILVLMAGGLSFGAYALYKNTKAQNVPIKNTCE